jgi:hypothetical protein
MTPKQDENFSLSSAKADLSNKQQHQQQTNKHREPNMRKEKNDNIHSQYSND